MMSANHTIYDNAPIIEALVDFRTPVVATQASSTFKADLISSLPDYKFENDIQENNFSVAFGSDGVPSTHSVSSIVGCAFRSIDEKRIFQFKLDGLASSRLSPYKDWEDTRSEVARMWEIHKRIMRPETVERVALRYVNRIDLPVDITSDQLQEYFTTSPVVSSVLSPRGLATYFLQLLIPLPNINGKAIINQGIGNQFRPDRQSIMLDIDVFIEQKIEANSEEIWTLLGKIRDEKNRIFEACITDKLRELIK